ncbi:unnamed protein product, partial [Musa hybrid cultivar]
PLSRLRRSFFHAIVVSRSKSLLLILAIVHGFDLQDQGIGTASAPSWGFSDAKDRYKYDFRDSGGIENQSVQESEHYAVYKAEETTNKLNGCLSKNCRRN